MVSERKSPAAKPRLSHGCVNKIHENYLVTKSEINEFLKKNKEKMILTGLHTTASRSIIKVKEKTTSSSKRAMEIALTLKQKHDST